MPVPSAITDLSTTAGSNSPAGTDPIGTDADNYIRAHAAFIAQLRDGSKNLEAGTATAPSLAFTGDTNTGIYSPGADGVSIVAGGAQRLYVGTTGATLPTGLVLQFNNATSDAAASIVNSGGAGVSTLDFKTASTVRLSISNSGVVTASGLIKANGGGSGLGSITVSTSAPSGGSDGDLWLRYE